MELLFALAGIVVKKSVDFIKENIQTCQDIGQLIGHVENAMVGEQQIIKARDKSGADICNGKCGTGDY